MRQLHFVGFTSDNDGLILAARRGAKTGTFVVHMDDELLDQIEQARLENESKAAPAAPLASRKGRVESNLSPREMQTRLRGGRTVAQVAAEAGVDIEWVERFAAPILAEQAAAVTRAFELVVRTPRRGSSDRPLAPSVVRNLADRGIRLAEDEFESAWSAFQLADNEWVIRFLYRSRGRDQHAEWLLDTAAGTLVPHNRLGTEMGYVDPGRHAPPVRGLPPVRVRGSVRRRRRVRKARAAKQTGPPRTAAPSKKVSAAARTAPPRKSAVKKVARAKKVANKKVTARRVAASRAGTKRVATKGAGSKRASTAKASTKKTSARKAPAKKRSPAKKAPARKTTASRSPGATKRTVARKSAAKKSATKSTARKTAPAKKAGAKKAGVKKAGARKAGTKKAGAGKATSARKSAGANRASTTKKAPARKRAVAASVAVPTASPRLNRPLRAARIASDGAGPRPLQTIRMTATGPALRPLRARRVETSDAPIGAGQFPRPRTNPIGGPAVQFRSGGPGEQEIPGLGV